jgi:hypothetical protein
MPLRCNLVLFLPPSAPRSPRRSGGRIRGKAAAAAVVIVDDCREAAVVFIIDLSFCSSGRGHVAAPAAGRSSGARVW